MTAPIIPAGQWPESAVALVSAVRTLNRSKHHEVRGVDDSGPVYWQRAEWIEWVLGIADELEAEIKAAAKLGDSQVIPEGQWPEWADRLCFDKNGAAFFFGACRLGRMWVSETEPADIEMPAGWDWRVPVIRPTTEDSSAVAPEIDLEQFRELLSHWKNSEYPLSYEGQHSQRALNACIADLQALIDGQAKSPTQAAWTDEQCAEFLAVAMRHVQVKGTLSMDEIRQGQARANALQPPKGEGEGNVRSSSEQCSEVATNPVTDDAVRRLVRAMENTPGDDLLEPNTRLCRRLLAAALIDSSKNRHLPHVDDINVADLQPTKGEGVAGG